MYRNGCIRAMVLTDAAAGADICLNKGQALGEDDGLIGKGADLMANGAA